MRRLLAVVLVALSACTFNKLGLNDLASDATPAADVDPNAPDADLTIPDATPVPDQAPGAPDACVSSCLAGDMIFDCGTGMPRPCPLGCDETGGAHCRVMIPSNDPDATTHLAGTTADLVVPYTFDTSTYAWSIFTDTGEIRDELGVPVRDPGTGVIDGIGYYQDGTLGIFTMDTLTIDDNAQLWGFGARALLIITSGNVTIHGVIDVSAGICPDGTAVNRSCPGPGGGFGAGGGVSPAPSDFASGCAIGRNGNDGGGDKTGGGGGGLGTSASGEGGNGADGDGTLGGAGGIPSAPGSGCPDETLVPLLGGSGGGWGGGTTGGRGSGGGGAVQISSYTSISFTRLSVPSLVGIWAGGAGGGLGTDDTGGGGGGAGGGILLEAPVVTIDSFSWLAANGGGGGGGNAGGNGNLGTFGSTAAAGGTGGMEGGLFATGGAGAALLTSAGDGQATGDGKGTGGGGGGVGIVRVNAIISSGGTTTSSPLLTLGAPAVI